MKRVQIFANKWWEADPLCWVALHDQAHPPSFTKYEVRRYPTFRSASPAAGSPSPPDPIAEPRITFECAGATVEIWCIQELMNATANSSSSAEKARVLAPVLSQPASLVIPFGTAGMRAGVHANGGVVIGRRVLVHDPTPATLAGKWIPPRPDAIIESRLPIAVLGKFSDPARAAAESRFVRPPVAPADPGMVFIGNGFVSVGVVNITNYDDYIWADASALAAFEATCTNGQAASIETTHGIVCSLTTSPFMFVSGITDEEGLFDFQVTPRTYAQNATAAHNAALALCWFLPDLIQEV